MGSLVPEGLPLLVGADNAQVSDLVGGIGQPGRALLFEAGLDHLAEPSGSRCGSHASIAFRTAPRRRCCCWVRRHIRGWCPSLPPRPDSMSHMRHRIGTWETGDLGRANPLPGRAAPESMNHPGSPSNPRGGVVNQCSAFVFRPEFTWGREFSLPIRCARGDHILMPLQKAHPLQVVVWRRTRPGGTVDNRGSDL